MSSFHRVRQRENSTFWSQLNYFKHKVKLPFLFFCSQNHRFSFKALQKLRTVFSPNTQSKLIPFSDSWQQNQRRQCSYTKKKKIHSMKWSKAANSCTATKGFEVLRVTLILMLPQFWELGIRTFLFHYFLTHLCETTCVRKCFEEMLPEFEKKA